MESTTATRGREIPEPPLLPCLEFQESLWPLERCGLIRGGLPRLRDPQTANLTAKLGLTTPLWTRFGWSSYYFCKCKEKIKNIIRASRRGTSIQVWLGLCWSVSQAHSAQVCRCSLTSGSSPFFSTPSMKLKAGTWRRTCAGTVLHLVRPTLRTPGTMSAISLQVENVIGCFCNHESYRLTIILFLLFFCSDQWLRGWNTSWPIGGPAPESQVAPVKCRQQWRVPCRALPRLTFHRSRQKWTSHGRLQPLSR